MLLILGWTIPPVPTASSVLVNNLANEMRDRVVLAGDAAEGDLGQWNVRYPIVHLNTSVSCIPFKRTSRWLKVRKTIGQSVMLVRENKAQHILSIFPDEFYLYVAWRTSKITGVPMYPWFHNTYLENRTGRKLMLARLLQPIVFRHAKLIFTMSAGMQDYYEQAYPEQRHKFRILRHCFEFNREWYKAEKRNDGLVHIAFSGSVNESCLDATLRLCEYFRDKPGCKLHLFGGNVKVLHDQYGFSPENFVYYKYLPADEFARMLSSMDVLLLPHGLSGKRSDVEYKTIFPTRTIPLLFAGVPILAHVPKETGLHDFLDHHGCASIADEPRLDSIDQAYESIVSNPVCGGQLAEASQRLASLYTNEQVVSDLESFLN